MFTKLSRSNRRPVSSVQRKQRPSLEALEGRELMSLGPIFGPINTTTRNFQYGSDNATSAGGSSVVVWTDTYRDSVNGSPADLDIRAQRYNSFGGKLGPEIIVAFTTLPEYSPSVAMNDQGQFVVSYTQAVGSDTNVLAQRFDSNGNAVAAPIQVGAGTFAESDSDVAMDRQGNFVVSYTRNTNYSNDNTPDVFAKLYNTSNQLLNVVNVAVTASADDHASVAMTPDGRFDVAWEHTFSTNDHDIYMNRYSASGSAGDQLHRAEHRLRFYAEHRDGHCGRRGGGVAVGRRHQGEADRFHRFDGVRDQYLQRFAFP